MRWKLIAAASLTAVAWVTAAQADLQSDQVSAGRAVYAEICAQCHGDSGEGGEGPALIGRGNALADYRNGRRLFTFLRDAMPNDNPGSLSEQQYYDVIAFLLSSNSWNPQSQPVDPATAESIVLGP